MACAPVLVCRSPSPCNRSHPRWKAAFGRLIPNHLRPAAIGLVRVKLLRHEMQCKIRIFQFAAQPPSAATIQFGVIKGQTVVLTDPAPAASSYSADLRIRPSLHLPDLPRANLAPDAAVDQLYLAKASASRSIPRACPESRRETLNHWALSASSPPPGGSWCCRSTPCGRSS